MEQQNVEVGDLFRDNDPRHDGRIVRVRAEQKRWGEPGYIVHNVEHWNEKLLGRETWVSAKRLTAHRNRKTGYTKVSH